MPFQAGHYCMTSLEEAQQVCALAPRESPHQQHCLGEAMPCSNSWKTEKKADLICMCLSYLPFPIVTILPHEHEMPHASRLLALHGMLDSMPCGGTFHLRGDRNSGHVDGKCHRESDVTHTVCPTQASTVFLIYQKRK